MSAIMLKGLSYLLALFLAFMGTQKFIGDVPIFEIIEVNATHRIGVNMWFIEPYGRYLTGALELAAAVLLVLRLRWGSLLALVIIAGAVLAHLTFLGISTPMSGAPGAEKSPVLFLMALGSLVVAALVAWLGWKQAASSADSGSPTSRNA